jgi:transcriptional regulator with XRE-family HTH domain
MRTPSIDRLRRLAHGLTLQDLEDATGTCLSVIRQVELGEIDRPDVTARIARHLDRMDRRHPERTLRTLAGAAR